MRNIILKILLTVVAIYSPAIQAEYSAAADTPILKKKTNFKCGTKKTCREMRSCKEAMFYLKVCGLKRLDRDIDGIPCENLCKKRK